MKLKTLYLQIFVGEFQSVKLSKNLFSCPKSFNIFNFSRLCLTKNQILKSMFHCTVGSQTYAEVYEVCTGYKVNESSELPNRICINCETELINYHKFRISIENVEQRLDNFLSHKKEEEITVEDVQLLPVERIEEDDDDQFEIEQLYDEEDFFESTEPEEVIEGVEESQYLMVEKTSLQGFENDELPGESLISCSFTQNEQKEIKCQTCVDSCETEKEIKKLRPEQDFKITCECSKVFKNKRSFTKHFATFHVNKKMSNFQCRGCEQKFPNWRSRVAHEAKIHNIGFKFSCSSCGKKFYRSDHFTDHKKSCNKIVEEKFFSCSICLFTFQREETYKKHLQTAHVGANETDTQFAEKAVEYAKRFSKGQKLEPDESLKISEEERNVCKFCDKTFKNNLSLNKHMSLFHSDQFWECEICQQVFIHRSTKVSHMSKAHGYKKPFVCNHSGCEFSCFKRDRFNAHIEKHENPNKKFPCPICQQEFNSYNTMTLHRARHLSKNTYACATCSKQFLDKRNYNFHLKLHSGENLHHCHVCSRGFNRKDHLLKHQKRKNHLKAVD